jgi:anti-sigma regulatory factor (Ser/Thr protein kinase)
MYFKLSKNCIINDIENWIKKNSPNLKENTLENIKITFGEVLQNIIRHGHKNKINEQDFIEVEYQLTGEKIIFLIRDYGLPCNPESFLNKRFFPSESGQMGLSIIRKLTDEFLIKPLHDGNETKLVFKIK